MTGEQELGVDDNDENKGGDDYLLLDFLYVRPGVCTINTFFVYHLTTALCSGHSCYYFEDEKVEAQSYEQAGKSKEIPNLNGLSIRPKHRSHYCVQFNSSSQSRNRKPGSDKNENNHHSYFSKSCSLVIFPENLIFISSLH